MLVVRVKQSKLSLPRKDKEREAIVERAAEQLGAIRVGHRLWKVGARKLGTNRMVALANEYSTPDTLKRRAG